MASMITVNPNYEDYLSRCEFPKLHSHYISVRHDKVWAGSTRMPGVNSFPLLKRFWGRYGSKIKTLRFSGYGEQVPDIEKVPVSFSMKRVFPNLYQLIVDANINVAIIEEFAKCSSVQILEIIVHSVHKPLIPVNLAKGQSIAPRDANNMGDDRRDIFSAGIGSHFENLKLIRFSSEELYPSNELTRSLGRYISLISDDLVTRDIIVTSLIEARK